MSSFLKIIENAKRVDLNTKDENGKSYADKLHEDMNSMRKTDEQLSQMHSQGFHATISKARSVEQRLIDSESDDEFYDEPDEPVDTDVDAETQAMLGDGSDISDSDDGEFLDFSEDDEDSEIEDSFEIEEDEIDESDYFDEPDEPEDNAESFEDAESDDVADETDTSFAEPDDDDYDDDVVEKEKDVEIESDESDSADMDETTNDEASDEASDDVFNIPVETESQELSVEDAEDALDPEPEDISEGDVKDTDGITVDQGIRPVTSVKSVSVNKESIISKKEMVEVMNKLSSESIDVINMLCDMYTFLGRKNAVNTIELDCGVKIPRSCYKLCLDVYHMMNDGDLGEAWFESEKTNPLSVWGTQLLLFPSDEHVDFMMEHGFDESGHESEEKE